MSRRRRAVITGFTAAVLCAYVCAYIGMPMLTSEACSLGFGALVTLTALEVR